MFVCCTKETHGFKKKSCFLEDFDEEVGILIRKLGKRVEPCHKCIDVAICSIKHTFSNVTILLLYGTKVNFENAILQ